MKHWYSTEKYHPIQAGSIDGIDTVPHDRAVIRAMRAQTDNLYDNLYDASEGGLDEERGSHLTLFVGRLGATTGRDFSLLFMKLVYEGYWNRYSIISAYNKCTTTRSGHYTHAHLFRVLGFQIV
jgi:hypothetical protein